MVMFFVEEKFFKPILLTKSFGLNIGPEEDGDAYPTGITR